MSTLLPQISFLSEEEQELIHEKALWLLSSVGMQLFSHEAVDIMRKAGARIENNNIVKIPENLVAYAIDKAPKREDCVLYGREEKYDIRFGKNTPTLGSMMEATHVVDLHTRQRRLCTNKDLADLVRMMDALENINPVAALVTPQDMPHDTAEWYALATIMKNTSKHIASVAMGAGFVRDAIRMASLVVGSEEKFREKPFVSFWVLARPPFQMDTLSLKALIELSRQGLPIVMSSGPILGITAPVTLAACVAQVHAEILCCLVLSQLVRPSTPFMYSSAARGFDMKTASVTMSSPEFAVLKGATAQMARYLGLPVQMCAFLRDAKTLDAQAGFEGGVVGLVSALCSDVFIGLQLDMDVLVDFADLVFCDEAMGALKRVARGFVIDDHTLALDVMKGIGHGGSFLGHQHTLKNFRKELWAPRLMERRTWARWEKDGKKDIEQRAREKAETILATHQPLRLSPEAEVEIDRIAREATVDYVSET